MKCRNTEDFCSEEVLFNLNTMLWLSMNEDALKYKERRNLQKGILSKLATEVCNESEIYGFASVPQ